MSLEEVPPFEAKTPAAARRQQIATYLRTWADVIASGQPIQINRGENVSSEHDPIEAVFIVALTADGEPVVGHRGLDAAATTEDYQNAWYDAGAALTRYLWDGQEGASRDYQYREKSRAARKVELQAHALAHPFVCGCKRVFATERGMAQHQARSRFHRRES